MAKDWLLSSRQRVERLADYFSATSRTDAPTAEIDDRFLAARVLARKEVYDRIPVDTFPIWWWLRLRRERDF